MKTVILNSDNVVVNVGVGEPSSPAPSGMTYVVVDKSVWVGVGCVQANDGTFYNPNPVEEDV